MNRDIRARDLREFLDECGLTLDQAKCLEAVDRILGSGDPIRLSLTGCEDGKHLVADLGVVNSVEDIRQRSLRVTGRVELGNPDDFAGFLDDALLLVAVPDIKIPQR